MRRSPATGRITGPLAVLLGTLLCAPLCLQAQPKPQKLTARYYADLARIEMAYKQYGKAAELLQKAAQAAGEAPDESVTYYTNMTALQMGARQYGKAAESARVIQKLQPAHSRARSAKYALAVSSVKIRYGQHSDASAVLKAALASAKSDAERGELLAMQATCQSAMGQKKEALATAREAAKLSTDYAAKARLLPLLLDDLVKNDPKAAADLMRSTVNAAPDLGQKHQAAMRICFSPAFQKNRAVMAAIVGTIDDDSEGVEMLKAEIDAMDKARMGRAIDIYEGLHRKHPGEDLPLQRLFFIAQAATRFKDVQAAIGFYEQILKLPDLAGSHRQAQAMVDYYKREGQKK